MPGKNAFDILKERGFVAQVTDEEAVRKLFATSPVTAYVGFDPTADSLHIGNLLGLMALANLQRAGHRPIAIIGDGTGMVGDPSGKTEMRKMLTFEQISANAEKIKAQINRYFTIDGVAGLAIHNSAWLLKLKHVDFLRDFGKHFSVNRMLSFEGYKRRMEKGLSFLELGYQLLQAYDFLVLYQDHACKVQLGGDDQWGNILSGVDLIRRVEGGKAECITWPLLTTAAGQKMGKTARGAVWLDASKVSPYEFYQYWINADDRDVERLLAYFTFLPMDEIQELCKAQGADIRQAKERLAYEATKLSHGEAEAEKARASSRAVFGGGMQDLSSVPATVVASERLQNGILVVDIFAEVGLATSRSNARKLVQQGGAYVNQKRIDNIADVISEADFDEDGVMLRAGKKRHHRLHIQS